MRVVLAALLGLVVVGCRLNDAINDGPLLNPKTGNGTPYPCPVPDDTYCGIQLGQKLCCGRNFPVCGNGITCRWGECCAQPYQGNTEWLESRRAPDGGASVHP